MVAIDVPELHIHERVKLDCGPGGDAYVGPGVTEGGPEDSSVAMTKARPPPTEEGLSLV